MLDPRLLEAFKAIAETGAVTRAAEELHLTQSAVSHRLKLLEKQLSTELFRRVGKKLVLTTPGNVFLVRTKRLLEDLDGLVGGTLAGRQRPRLRFSASCFASYRLLHPVIREFRDEFPEVELVVAAEHTRRAVEAIREGSLDVALVSLPTSSKQLRVEPAFEDELVAIVLPSHHWAARSSVAPKAFEGETLITYARGTHSHSLLFDVFARGRVNVQSVIEVELTEGITGMVKLGLGVGVLASWAAVEEISRKTVAMVRIGSEGLPHKWGLASRLTRRSPDYVEAFLDICRRHLNPMMTSGAAKTARVTRIRP